MTRDRADSPDELYVTHGSLAYMLGVRRAGGGSALAESVSQRTDVGHRVG